MYTVRNIQPINVSCPLSWKFKLKMKVFLNTIQIVSKSAIFKRNGSYQTCSGIQEVQIIVESVFTSRFTMNNIGPKLQKCWTQIIAFKIIPKMPKQPNFIYSQPSTLSKEALAKFYLSMTFGLCFMINSVAPTRSSTFYAYLITKIGNRNLKKIRKKLALISAVLKSYSVFFVRCVA